MAGGSSPWIVRPRPLADPALRLFCLPYAGGGSLAFRDWPGLLPDGVELCVVELPGRERRFGEPLLTSMAALLDDLAPALLPWLDRPFALFGHSMGAAIAYETARAVMAHFGRSPAMLFLSGRRAPQLPHRRPAERLSDAAFIERLRELGGTPPEVLAHGELMDLLLPILRADFELSETYSQLPGPRLACPLAAFGGRSDPEVGQDELAAWSETTSGPFDLQLFEGGHFYLNHRREEVLAAIGAELMKRTAVSPLPQAGEGGAREAGG